MELETLKDLYVHELKDLYSAENQLIKALPKMAKSATTGNYRPRSVSIWNKQSDRRNASNKS